MTRFADLLHPAAGTALISRWRTGTADRSRTAVAAMAEEWTAAEPPPGRLSQHVFRSLDGAVLLFYAQWTSDEAHLAWARSHRGKLVSRVDTLVPGIERPGLHRTRLHHSVVHDADTPAALIAVCVRGADDVDAALHPRPGLLATHVHLTPDGQRAHLVTEWAATPPDDQLRAAGPEFTCYTLAHVHLDRG